MVYKAHLVRNRGQTELGVADQQVNKVVAVKVLKGKNSKLLLSLLGVYTKTQVSLPVLMSRAWCLRSIGCRTSHIPTSCS